MAEYEVLKGMTAYGKVYSPGDTVDLADNKAHVLLGMKRIKPVEVKAKPAKTTRAVGLPEASAEAPTKDLETR